MADGLDLDIERILEKGLLQEVETGAVVPVGIFHAENGSTPQHCVRYIQKRPGYLGILKYAGCVREIIPVR